MIGDVVGLVAGRGELPVITAHGIRESGRAVACALIGDGHDPALESQCDHVIRTGLGQVGRWIRWFRKCGASAAVLAGNVRKSAMYDSYYVRHVLHRIPDFRTIRLWLRTTRHDKRTDALLRAVAHEFSRDDVPIISPIEFLDDVMADAGTLTSRCQPDERDAAKMAGVLSKVSGFAALDVGQTLAVCHRGIIAVEAMEGTDVLIRRAGTLCAGEPWTLVKVAKVGQDMRFDIPAVGVRTIEEMAAAGGRKLYVEAGRVIMINKDAVVAAADAAGIAIVGFHLTPNGKAGKRAATGSGAVV